MRHADSASLPAPAARDVLLVRAYETAGPATSAGVAGPATPTPLWTEDDARWATRLARASDAAAPPAGFIAARARHALERLEPREPRIAALRRTSGSDMAGKAGASEGGDQRRRMLLLGAVIGLIAGLGIDHIGHTQRINLLAPPVWAVVAWNLGVGLWLALAALRARLRPAGNGRPAPSWLASAGLQRWLGASWPGPLGSLPTEAPLRRFAADWWWAQAPLVAARAALVLHVAAITLALGLAAGMYLRGLVLDYRAGWQSTFLEAGTVQRWLDASLAPASQLTGIAVPDVAPLRVLPGATEAASGTSHAKGPAAPWIHLYAAMLLLFVIAPRGLLALHGAARARRLAQAVALPLHEPYFQRLLAARAGHAPQLWVLPAAPLDADTALRLREALVPRLGAELQLRVAPSAAAEEPMAGLPPGATPAAFIDLATTPEAEIHGRLLTALTAASPAAQPVTPPVTPPLLVLDTTAFHRRFATLPARIAEREALWRHFAATQGVECLFVDLGRSAGP